MMNDITLHFMACFLITVVVFLIQQKYLEVKYMPSFAYSRTAERYWWLRITNEAVTSAIIWALVAGVAKELWDIWYSDPQWHDLVADIGGALLAGAILWLVSMKWIEWRFRA